MRGATEGDAGKTPPCLLISAEGEQTDRGGGEGGSWLDEQSEPRSC